ncbi:MAG TPA: pepsin/retropepsin-like aspartic protease family protein [Planctomycetota bacterium]|nr:pepsin/retropepsin-like aspartic protease family protein [Planctomycetota bacterium]
MAPAPVRPDPVSRRELLGRIAAGTLALRSETPVAPDARGLVVLEGQGIASKPASGALARCNVPLVYDDKGGLFVDAKVASRGPHRFVFDTGASRSTISTAMAEKLGLAVREGEEIEGSAGTVKSGSAIAELEVPGLGAMSVDFAVYAFASYDAACVGIVGYELLRRAAWRVRYREKTLEWNAPAPAKRVEMTLDHRIPRIEALVNGRALPLRLDTGAAFPPGDDAYLNLTSDQAAALGLGGKPAAVLTATGTGGATLELPVYRLQSLEVAGKALARSFAIVQPKVGYFARADAVGFLGNSVLDKLDPHVDYASERFGVGP